MDLGHVSWLVLERYWLGELEPAEKARVELALEASEDLRRCLEKIRADAARPLSPLPKDAASLSAPSTRSTRSRDRTPWRWTDRWRALAAACAGLVAIVGGWAIWSLAGRSWEERPKGDHLSLELVRESQGTILEDASVFAEGDLFRVRITCARLGALSWQVSAFQGKDVFFPLPNAEPIHCGNRVLLPGTFRLTGTAPVIVCLSLEDAIVAPERLAQEGIEALPATASCTHVRPLPHP